MNSTLVLEHVSYAYRSDWSRSLVNVIRDITLEVGDGEAFGFLGHNGAGKTTTIKCILGLCKIQKGTIKIFGQQHTNVESRSCVGYLPEQPYFYENLTVLESLVAYGSLANVRSKILPQRIDELLSILSLQEKKHAKMRSLSKGLMQRIGLAQAIIAEPKLLILDEPFSGLDPIGRKEFRDIILDLKRRGTTIFMSSHILNDVETICDRASIMVRGEIKGIYNLRTLPGEVERDYEILIHFLPEQTSMLDKVLGSIDYIEKRVEGSYCHLSLKGGVAAHKSLQVLLSNKMNVQAFEPIGSSLEKVFIDLVKGDR